MKTITIRPWHVWLVLVLFFSPNFAAVACWTCALLAIELPEIVQADRLARGYGMGTRRRLVLFFKSIFR